jgi:hypothetical protein
MGIEVNCFDGMTSIGIDLLKKGSAPKSCVLSYKFREEKHFVRGHYLAFFTFIVKF